MVEQPTGPTREQLIELVVQQAALAAEGSFADRNPLLGKMRKCPQCGRRGREKEVCCNPKYIHTNANEVPRSFYAKKRKIPRLSRHRPSLFEMHDILVGIERKMVCTRCGQIKEEHEDWLYCDEQRGDHVFTCQEQEGISGIVEARIVRKRTARRKKKNNQQKLSRKINRRKQQ